MDLRWGFCLYIRFPFLHHPFFPLRYYNEKISIWLLCFDSGYCLLIHVNQILLNSHICFHREIPFQPPPHLSWLDLIRHTRLRRAIMFFHTPLSQILDAVEEGLKSLLVPFYRALFIQINEDGIDVFLWFPDCAAIEIFAYKFEG